MGLLVSPVAGMVDTGCTVGAAVGCTVGCAVRRGCSAACGAVVGCAVGAAVGVAVGGVVGWGKLGRHGVGPGDFPGCCGIGKILAAAVAVPVFLIALGVRGGRHSGEVL